MALTGPFTYSGIVLPDSYVRAENFVFVGKFECRAQMEVYSDQQQAFTVPYNPLTVVMCDFLYDPDGASVNTQAYTAALLLPEFTGFQPA
jgi:hypothetical protein